MYRRSKRRSDAVEYERQRLLLLSPTTSYQLKPFVCAAERLGAEVVVATDRCPVLAKQWQGGPLPLKFSNGDEAVRQIVEFAREHPVDAIVGVGDRATVLAARASRALGLAHNDPEATEAANNKAVMRRLLQQSGVRQPAYWVAPVDDDARRWAAVVSFPCVLKPLHLAASQGVIRADTEAEFVAAFERIGRLLASPELLCNCGQAGEKILIEEFVPGQEVAVEALLVEGRLIPLAIFDKPDPLDGPYFEETIYVTPSRLPVEVQTKLLETTARAATALGLRHGPVHAELRWCEEGPWLIEVAARTIGGLCSRTLSFAQRMSLEELVIRHALGKLPEAIARADDAAGVMMIPVPGAGELRQVRGIPEAEAVPGIEEVVITAKPGEHLVPLPEGSSYPGFIFARGRTPEEVEDALRRAHARLRFDVAPLLPVAPEW
jgi:biotin carboxylase